MTTAPVLERISALSDPIRARLLLALEAQELTVGELMSALQLPQSTVSRHLKVLVEQGWIVKRAEGTRHFYRQDVDPARGCDARLWALVRDELEGTPACEQDRARLDAILRQRSARSAEFFSETAARWDEVRRELYGERFDLAGLLGLLDPEWRVGDLGCGTGQLAAALAPFVREVVAVDASEAMLEAARARLDGLGNVAVRAGQLEALPVDDGALDLAILSLVLHHLPDPARAIREAVRCLAPGGRLLIVDMLAHDRDDLRQQMGHVWLGFAPGEIAERLRRAGLERVAVRPLPADPAVRGPLLFVAVGRRPSAAESVPDSATTASRSSRQRRAS
ncbi:MAG TPA: metalloregulator ArsR/SmtB family transcription factor [Thermoanaerobaculia bacterium]|nr:metalloregulator ArsR/SmtB family transcription factor [Thermoanaerobaculia bacterium]